MFRFLKSHQVTWNRSGRVVLASWLLAVFALLLFSYLLIPRTSERAGSKDSVAVSLAPKTLIAWQGDGPFGPRQRIGDFPEGLDWLNTKSSLQLKDLKGKLVLLDFWTYCCINCMHILPTLKKAEDEFGDELVVVGVHTAKFTTEKDTENIRSAILRYEIKHPVLNDAEHLLWDQLGVGSWPTLVLIDPEGYAIWASAGEIPYDKLQKVLEKATTFYKRKNLLDERKVHFDLVEYSIDPTPLRFPGKILADGANDRLFISDSNHNRIVVTKTDGTLLQTIGSGRVGAEDGDYETASFNHPQGLALEGDSLWVADTENHLIRKVDLNSKKVSTVAGTGKQTETAWPGLNFGASVPKKLARTPKNTPLGSPWDLWIAQDTLWIAMAGPHQIWRMDLQGKGISQYAGNGREDIVDGALLPKRTYEEGSSSFAQPSGLSSDGKSLFVADSEGSSIRSVPLDGSGEVSTIIGTSQLPKNRLFTFGDVDGPAESARLQHPLAVAYRDGKIFVADTYNNKVRSVDAKTGEVATLIGDGKSGSSDSPPQLDEPSGLSLFNDQLYIADTNNHLIRVYNLNTSKLTTLKIEGLTPPKPKTRPEDLKIAEGAPRKKLAVQSIDATTSMIDFEVQFELPEGLKLNTLADFPITLIQSGEAKLNRRISVKVKDNKLAFQTELSALEKQTVQLAIGYFYCQADDSGLCLADTIVLEVPIERKSDSANKAIKLEYTIDP